jgi:hypothetical protein
METYPARDERNKILSRILGKKSRAPRLTVIGPANQLKMIKKEKDLISAWVSSR